MERSNIANPHTKEQNILLERIIKNVEKCNEAVVELNTCVQEYLLSAGSISLASELMTSYTSNAAYYLEKTDKLPPPEVLKRE